MKAIHIHFIGIGGTGLSAIARLLLETGGYTVSGSDQLLSPLALDIQEAGATVFTGHAADNVKGADIVVRSSAIPDSNPEVQAALAAGIPVKKRADFLGDFMAARTGIAVAGTHGKTTTTAMIAWMLTRLEQDPSYIIGGISKNLSNNAHAGTGDAFVIEADEYDRMFLGLGPQIAVVTNLEHDHPDCFPTPEDYLQAFQQFVESIRSGGLLLACLDDPGAAQLAREGPEHVRSLVYSVLDTRTPPDDLPADYCALHLELNTIGCYQFEVWFRGETPQNLGVVSLQVPGEYNVSNALAAFAVVHQSGFSPAGTTHALEEFVGTQRRFDVRGEVGGVTVIDDYAHHPVEIVATLGAARKRYLGSRLVAVWQPHTYSRTQMLSDAFIEAFDRADRVIVTEVYAARETSNGYSAAQVVERMSHPGAVFIASLDAVVKDLLAWLAPGDVVIVLSAGDADRVSVELLEKIASKENQYGQATA